MTLSKEQTIEIVLRLVNSYGLKKKGSLFVITNNSKIFSNYETLYPDLFSNKYINIERREVQTLLNYLSDMDGAIILKEDGLIIDYGAKIKQTEVLLGHGTRHSAALGISKLKDCMAILSSEEDGKVRIFKDGVLTIELDPTTGKKLKLITKIAHLLSRKELQIATSGGLASLFIGLNPLVAGIIFTGSYVITKFGMGSIKEFIETGEIAVKEIRNTTEGK